MAQLAGGVLASLIVYLITMGFAIWLTADYNTYNDFTNVIHSMGGGTPYLRGFFTHGTNGGYESFNLYKPIDFSSYDNKGIQFGYSSIQGIINVKLCIDFDNISAYVIENGKIKTIVDNEERLIGVNIIDSVSDEFNDVFDALLSFRD